MADLVTAPNFLELLKRSELLTAEQFVAAVQKLELRTVKDASTIADRLVRHRLITPFQGERLLAGRSRGFFIDEYKVLEILGVGGMGSIYIAEDTGTQERVALKVLSSRHDTDSGMQARFRLESEAGLKLDHPNLCRTIKIGDTGAITYFAMEFVKGVSLHEFVVLSGPVRWKQCCDFFMQAALGLHFAHQRGLIHRDVKPANLLVDRAGHLKVVDFGLALVRDSKDDEFSLQMIFGHDCLGTADFIAPEQANNSSKIDHRADIYGLGCTMYTALTGKLPFPVRETKQKLDAHRKSQARSIREINPEIPEAVQQIVEKMMHKQPGQRFPSCLEVAKALKPHSVREGVRFDFPRILSLRIKESKQRSEALHIGHSTAVGSGLKSRKAGSSRSQLPDDTIETVVGEDTAPARMASDSNLRSGNSSSSLSKSSGEMNAQELMHRADEARRFLQDRNTGTMIPLVGKTIRIGRGENCRIVIDDPAVSSEHCELTAVGTEWDILDLKSKNGILVNGKRVMERSLLPGDRITIGKRIELLYRVREAETSEPEPGQGPLYFIIAMILVALAAAAWWLTR